MKLLRDKYDFRDYKDEKFFAQRIHIPRKYPCYVYEMVVSWGMEESTPVYLYAKDLEEMLQEMKNALEIS